MAANFRRVPAPTGATAVWIKDEELVWKPARVVHEEEDTLTVKIRKEEFGVEVFGLLQESEEKKKKSGIAAVVSGAMSKISDQEKAIQACIDRAKQDVLAIGRRQNFAETEIRSIDQQLES